MGVVSKQPLHGMQHLGFDSSGQFDGAMLDTLIGCCIKHQTPSIWFANQTQSIRVVMLALLLSSTLLFGHIAQAQPGSVISDCATATTVEEFITLFGRGLCLNGFSSSRGWVLTDPADSVSAVPDPLGGFPLPVVSFSGDLEFRAEAETINSDEPDKFYIVSQDIADLPPFQRPTLPHPQVMGPFFYGTISNPTLITLDQNALTQILDYQQNNSADNRIVILQHMPGFDFNSPGVERFTGVRFEQSLTPIVKINELCPEEDINRNVRGGQTQSITLEIISNMPNIDLTGYRLEIIDNGGDLVQPFVFTVGSMTNSAGIATVDFDLPTGLSLVFGIKLRNPGFDAIDSATFAESGNTASDELSAILDDPDELAANIQLGHATAWINAEKTPFSNLGSHNTEASCGETNRSYFINEIEVTTEFDGPGGIPPFYNFDQQFVEIYTNQQNLNGLMLVTFDGTDQQVFRSIDLEPIAVNSEGYASVGPRQQFLVASDALFAPDTDHLVEIRNRTNPLPPPGTPQEDLPGPVISSVQYLTVGIAGTASNVSGRGDENKRGHLKRDSMQSCPDTSIRPRPNASPFGGNLRARRPTLNSINQCGFNIPITPRTDADSSGSVAAGDPINAATGEFYTIPTTDIDLGGPLPLRFIRRYAAFLSDNGRVNSSLGPNWLHDFEIQLTMSDSETIEIVYFGGQLLTFNLDTVSNQWMLIEPLQVPFQLKLAGDEYRLLDPRRNQVYTFDGNSLPEVFGRLLSIEDRNGNRLDLNYQPLLSRTLATVLDGLGRALDFSYSNGLLTGVSDGTRNLGFAYTNGILTSYVDALSNQTSYQYDTSTTHGPLLTTIVRPEGNTPFTQSYDSNGAVIQQLDAFSSPMDIALDTPEPGLTTVTDLDGSQVVNHEAVQNAAIDILGKDGQQLRLNYDAASRLQLIVDRESEASLGITIRGYHLPSGKLASFTDAEDNTTRFDYQQQTQIFGNGTETVSFDFYNLQQINYADSSNTQFSHDASGNVLSITNPLGFATLISYNNQGLPVSITGPNGGILGRSYNADGTLDSVADAATDDTLYLYDSLKRLISIQPPQTNEPLAPRIDINYDASDRITSITDANGNLVQFSYDRNDNLISVEDPNNLLANFSFDLTDQLDMLTNRLNQTLLRSYDALRRLASITDADGISTGYGYNVLNDLTSITIGPSTLSIVYDNEGIPTSINSPLGLTTALESDRLGRFTAVQNPLGQRTEFDYDNRGNVAEIRSADNSHRNFVFDPNSALMGANKFDPADNPVGSATYAYTQSGLLSEITDLNGSQWMFGYTPEGRVSNQTDPLSQSIAFSHDIRGRINQIDFPDGGSRNLDFDANDNITQSNHSGGPNLSFSFDNQNRLTSTNDLDLAYDAEGAVTETVSNGVGFTAAYTPGRRLASVGYNNGQFSVNYQYNSITGLLESISDDLTGTQVSFIYDLDRRLIRIERNNDTQTTYSYDQANRLTGITGVNTQTATTYLDLQYSINSIGDVISQQLQTPLNLDSSLFTQGSQNYTVDAASQVDSAGFSYDQRGRRISTPQDTINWDDANRLVQLNGHILGYNGLGDLITQANTKLIHFHHHAALAGRPMLAEQNVVSATFERFYVFTPDGLLLYMIDVINGNAVHHFDFDRVGSTQLLTDSAGNVSNAYAYLPFGQKLGQTGNSPQPFTFNGQLGIRQLDDSGRYYHMRARVYDSHTASFVSREPLWPLISNPDLLNPYQFAFQNPMRFVDANGLTPQGFQALTDEQLKEQLSRLSERLRRLRQGGGDLSVSDLNDLREEGFIRFERRLKFEKEDVLNELNRRFGSVTSIYSNISLQMLPNSSIGGVLFSDIQRLTTNQAITGNLFTQTAGVSQLVSSDQIGNASLNINAQALAQPVVSQPMQEIDQNQRVSVEKPKEQQRLIKQCSRNDGEQGSGFGGNSGLFDENDPEELRDGECTL